MSGIKTFVGFTRAIVIDDNGDRYSYNAHPYYHDAPWYDWAYVYYEIKDNGNSKAVHYPSKILGFLQDGEEINAVIQCAIEPVPWSRLKEEFISKFSLNTDVGEEEIVPMSSLVVRFWSREQEWVHDDTAERTMERLLC